MQLSNNSVQILDGKVVLSKRKRSSHWQARYKIGSTWIRTTTKESDLDKAKAKATDLYLRALYRAEDGKPPISKKFSAVAKFAIEGMRAELAAGHGKRIYDTHINAIEKYLIPYYGNHNIDNIDLTH